MLMISFFISIARVIRIVIMMMVMMVTKLVVMMMVMIVTKLVVMMMSRGMRMRTKSTNKTDEICTCVVVRQGLYRQVHFKSWLKTFLEFPYAPCCVWSQFTI